MTVQTSKLSVLRRKGGRGLIVILFGIGATALSSLVAARVLDADQFGLYAVTVALLNYGVLLARGGLNTLVVRYVNQYRASGQEEMVASLVRWSRKSLFRISLTVSGVGIGIGLALRPVFPGTSVAGVWVAGLGLIPLALVQFHTALLRAEKRIVWSELPTRVLRPLIVLGCATAMWLVNLTSGVILAAFEVVGLLLLVLPLSRATRHFRAGAGKAPRIMEKEWQRATGGMTLSALSQQMIGQADVIMIGVAFGLTEAGVYGLASRFAKLMGIGKVAASSVAGPLIAEAFHSNDRRSVESIAAGIATIVGLFALVMFGGAYIMPREAYAWVGAGYDSLRTVFLVLAAGQVVNAFTGPVGDLLLMTGHHHAQTVVNFTFGLGLMVGIAMLGAFGGSVGQAAVLTSAAFGGSNVVKAIVVYRRTGVRSHPTLNGLNGFLD